MLVWIPKGIKNEWEPPAMDDSHSAVIVHNCDKLFDADFYRRLQGSIPISDFPEFSQTIPCLDTILLLLIFVDNHFKHHEDALSSAVKKPP